MTLIVMTLAWIAGLWCADLVRPGPIPGALLAAASAGGMLLSARRPRWRQIAMAGLAFALALARLALAQPDFGPAHIRHQIGREVLLEGVIVAEPRWTPAGQTLLLSADHVSVDRQVAPADGIVLVSLPPEPPRQAGERLLLKTTLVAPRNGKTSTFDYVAYLEQRNVFALTKNASVEAAAAPEPSPLAAIRSLKEHTRRLIVRSVPEPQASLLVGILLGIQSSIAPEVWSTFNRTGTSHILVISGWNISIICLLLLGIGKRMGWRRWPSTLAALAVVVAYVLLVGASASVLRAALMGAIVALANPLQRRADAWTALAAACLIMTAINPYTLWDMGFQLSALATASLFAWGGPVERGVRRVIRWRWLEWMVEPLTATLAAQVWALPIIMYNFGNVSLVAPLANVLMVPAVPLAMAAGAALAVAGLAWRPLALLVLPLAWLALSWLIWVARLLAAWQRAAVSLPPFHVGWIVVFYALSLAGWGWMLRTTLSADCAAPAIQQPPG
ncbi:MAG TPA: ComEC/Rec2 family competence protein [Herpetosiphonaceae bacterium]|nr:ComEC/Rec2 family competence protein [Herpetosiphonaceae bacterium]